MATVGEYWDALEGQGLDHEAIMDRLFAAAGATRGEMELKESYPLDEGAIARVEEDAARMMSVEEPGLLATDFSVEDERRRLKEPFDVGPASYESMTGNPPYVEPDPNDLDLWEAAAPEFLQDIPRMAQGVPTKSGLYRGIGEAARYAVRPPEQTAPPPEQTGVIPTPGSRRFRPTAAPPAPMPAPMQQLTRDLEPPSVAGETSETWGGALERDRALDPETPGTLEEFREWTKRVPERAWGAVVGAGEAAYALADEAEEIVAEFGRFEAKRASNLAMEAKERGEDTVQVTITSGAMFGREPEVIEVKTDDLIQDPSQPSLDYARREAQRRRMSDLVKTFEEEQDRKMGLIEAAGGPELLSLHTIKFWREEGAATLSALGQLTLHFMGVSVDPSRDKLDQLPETFLAAKATDRALGLGLANGAIGGFAHTILHPRDSAQVYGPLALMDVLPYVRGLKAAAVAGRASLPPGAMGVLNKAETMGMDVVRAVVDTPVWDVNNKGGKSLADGWHTARRLFADAASNRDKLMTEFYDDAIREGQAEQNILTSVVERIGAAAARGEVTRGDLPEFANAEHQLFDSEIAGFKEATEVEFRKLLEEADLSPEVKPDIPDEVRARVAERVESESPDTESLAQIHQEEMARFVGEGGQLTAKRTLPGTQKEGHVQYDLSAEDAALWDQLVKNKEARRKEILKDSKSGKLDKKLAGRLLGKVEGHHKKDLRQIGEGTHPVQGKRLSASEGLQATIRKQAEDVAAAAIRAERNPFGVRGVLDPREVPIQSELIAVVADFLPDKAKVQYATPSAKDRDAHAKSIAAQGLTKEQRMDSWARFDGTGRYRGAEYRTGPGIPEPVEVVTPRPEYSAAVKAQKERGVSLLADSPQEVVRLNAEIDANIARSIDDGLAEQLRSRSGREALAQDLTTILVGRSKVKYGRAGKRALKTSIYRLLDEAQARVVPESGAPGSSLPHNIIFRTKLEGGKISTPINLIEEVAKKTMEDTALAKRVMAESIHHTAVRMGIRRAQKVAQDVYLKEADKAFEATKAISPPNKRDMPQPNSEAARAVLSVLETGSLPPMLLFRPNSVHSAMVGKGALPTLLRDVNRLSETKYTPEQVSRAVKDAQRRVQRYSDMGAEEYGAARRHFRVSDDLWNAQQKDKKILGERMAHAKREVDVEYKPSGGFEADGTPREGASVYVQKNLLKALDNYGKAQESVANASFLLAMTTRLKSNLTARQITTLKNNVLSNVMLQAVRHGTPRVLTDAIESTVKYKQYEQGGKGLTEMEVAIFDDLEASGKLNTSFVDGELGAMRGGGVFEKMIGEGWSGINLDTAKWLMKLDLPGKALEGVYKFSDELFKIDEGVRQWKIISGWGRKLNPGEWMELRVGPNKKVRAAKNPDGTFSVDGVKLSDKQWGAVKGRAAMQVGEDLFFNFLDVPDFARLVRTTSITPALASPFYTWLNKATDVPFFKRGLVTEMLSGTGYVRTNSAAVHADVFGRQAAIGTSFNVIQEGHQTDPYDREAMKELRKIQGWGKNEQAMLINYNVKGQMLSFPLQQASFMSGASLFARAIEQSAVAVDWAMAMWDGDDAWITDKVMKAYGEDGVINPRTIAAGIDEGSVTDEQRSKTLELRKWLIEHGTGTAGISAADSLDLVGLGGHMFLEIWHLVSEAEARDKPVPWGGAVGRRFGAMMLGGTYMKAFDAIVGGVAPGSRLTSRYDSADPLSGEEIAFTQWAMRHVTGVGWNRKNLFKRGKSYFKRLEKRWSDSLVAPIQADSKRFFNVSRDPLQSPQVREQYLNKHTNAEKLWIQMDAVVKAEAARMYKIHLTAMKEAGLIKETREGMLERREGMQ